MEGACSHPERATFHYDTVKSKERLRGSGVLSTAGRHGARPDVPGIAPGYVAGAGEARRSAGVSGMNIALFMK